jgi:hypothetical protein
MERTVVTVVSFAMVKALARQTVLHVNTAELAWGSRTVCPPNAPPLLSEQQLEESRPQSDKGAFEPHHPNDFECKKHTPQEFDPRCRQKVVATLDFAALNARRALYEDWFLKFDADFSNSIDAGACRFSLSVS